MGRCKRLLQFLGAAPLLLCISAGAATAPSSRPSPHRIAIGVYFNPGGKDWAPNTEKSFEDLRDQTGRSATLFMNFQSWTEPWNQFPTRLADNCLKNDALLMIVWVPSGKQETGADPNWTCDSVADGKHDAYIRQYAADVKKWGHPLMIRMAHEMNGTWTPYGTAFDKDGRRHNGNQPADYQHMWRHVHDIFRDAGAKNVIWVWSPNVLLINKHNTIEQQKEDLRAMYPGDAYVDWIGLDGYNDGIHDKWRSFADIYRPSIDFISQLSQKPLMIAEFGCSEKGAPAGTSKAAWITQTYSNDIPEFPRVRMVNWFDRDKHAQGEADWRFNSSPEALKAYKEAVNALRYQGTIPQAVTSSP